MDHNIVAHFPTQPLPVKRPIGHVARVRRDVWPQSQVVKENVEVTKLECEVVESRVCIYCSPKLAEHAARHARCNAVQHPESESLAPHAGWRPGCLRIIRINCSVKMISFRDPFKFSWSLAELSRVL